MASRREISRRSFCQGGLLSVAAIGAAPRLAIAGEREHVTGPILQKQAQLDRWNFWHNRDWDWYQENIPFWESPDESLDRIFYYRAEVLTKHLRYAAPDVGYIFTEFSGAEPLPWAGRFNGIASAADLQLEECRWLKTRQYAEDYARYWMQVPGAQPRNYGFAAAWSTWAVGMVHGDQRVACALLDRYIENYAQWEKGLVEYPHDHGFDSERKLFWNTGRDMGGEFNLASCQLSESLRGIEGYKIRGGAGYRPDMNAVMYGEASAISWIAALARRDDVSRRFSAIAAMLKENTQKFLWDPRREFFLHRWKYDEYSEGDSPGKKSIRAWSLIWETNADRFGGTGYNPLEKGVGHGRELTGYIPWRYGLPDDAIDAERNYAAAWKFLTSPDHFSARYGPTTAELHDPWFYVIDRACRHNGQSWPFHTARILNAAARFLHEYEHRSALTRATYWDLFSAYVRTQYKDGRPWLAEAHSPFEPVWVQDEWPGIDYFHSSFIDLVITGLAGLQPSNDDALAIDPLAPPTWEYFALDDVRYRNHTISIVWDRDGRRYGLGPGLTVIVDGAVAARSKQLRRVDVKLTPAPPDPQPYIVNVAANCENKPFPKATASFTAKYDSAASALNGLCWYDSDYGTRWTCRGSWRDSDWFQIDFGEPRNVDAVRLSLYADAMGVSIPSRIQLQAEVEGQWVEVVPTATKPAQPRANSSHLIRFARLATPRMRVLLSHARGAGVGLSQIEVLAET